MEIQPARIGILQPVEHPPIAWLFLRWLTTGPVLDRDPAPFVRGRRTLGESAAGTDAA